MTRKDAQSVAFFKNFPHRRAIKKHKEFHQKPCYFIGVTRMSIRNLVSSMVLQRNATSCGASWGPDVIDQVDPLGVFRVEAKLLILDWFLLRFEEKAADRIRRRTRRRQGPFSWVSPYVIFKLTTNGVVFLQT